MMGTMTSRLLTVASFRRTMTAASAVSTSVVDQRRDGERILERLAHRVADHLADAAPADEARHGEQAGRHRAAELLAPPALGEGVDDSRPGRPASRRKGGRAACISGPAWTPQRRWMRPAEPSPTSRTPRLHRPQTPPPRRPPDCPCPPGWPWTPPASGRTRGRLPLSFFSQTAASISRNSRTGSSRVRRVKNTPAVSSRMTINERREGHAPQMQGEQVAPQQTVDALDELNEHSISSQCLDLAVLCTKTGRRPLL